jgi:hypothetical protein
MNERQHPRFHTAGAGAVFAVMVVWWAVRPFYIVTVGLLSLGAHRHRFTTSRVGAHA